MSCCGGNCGCGAGCKCGSGCGGCKMFPEELEANEVFTAAETVILGVAPEKGSPFPAGSENDCKCGSNCTCDPCTCK